MASLKNVLTNADEVLLSLAQIESIKDEFNKNSKLSNAEKLCKEAHEGLQEAKRKLSTIQFRIHGKEYNQLKRKYTELCNFFKTMPLTQSKFDYDEQPSIDSFNMDEIQQTQSSVLKETQNTFKSQSVLKPFVNEFRSKSLTPGKRGRKPFKEPVCVLTPTPSKKPRPISLASFDQENVPTQRKSIKPTVQIEDTQMSQKIPRKSLRAQLVIPDSQVVITQDPSVLFEKPKRLTIRIVQDEELIPLTTLGEGYWDNISNGRMNLAKEFEKDFDF